jgi:hypothetical protein
MSEIPTVKIRTGQNSYITVNQEDYESFKFMEYVEPANLVTQAPVVEREVINTEPSVEVITDQTPTRKKKNQTDEV